MCQQEVTSFKLFDLPKSDRFKLLSAIVFPRPIAWITTRNQDEGINVAPFSFFNVISSDPPLVALSFAEAADRDGKDTLSNIQARKEFVVNLVPEELAERMSLTATNAPRGMDETKIAGLTLGSSQLVQVPRIMGCPVSLECREFQVIDPGGSTTIVLGEILLVQTDSAIFRNVDTYEVDPSRMHLIGHMQNGTSYCRTTDLFTMERKSWPLT
jgi:flavin reductase (DIM6/NTAB) family NADH-FMN oxidoreductase RutF